MMTQAETIDIPKSVVQGLDGENSVAVKNFFEEWQTQEYGNAVVSITCSIAGELMEDPVTVVESGQSYGRVGIERWFLTHDTDPLTNQQLADKTLTENKALKCIIAAVKSLIDPEKDETEEVIALLEERSTELLERITLERAQMEKKKESTEQQQGREQHEKLQKELRELERLHLEEDNQEINVLQYFSLPFSLDSEGAVGGEQRLRVGTKPYVIQQRATSARFQGFSDSYAQGKDLLLYVVNLSDVEAVAAVESFIVNLSNEKPVIILGYVPEREDFIVSHERMQKSVEDEYDKKIQYHSIATKEDVLDALRQHRIEELQYLKRKLQVQDRRVESPSRTERRRKGFGYLLKKLGEFLRKLMHRR